MLGVKASLCVKWLVEMQYFPDEHTSYLVIRPALVDCLLIRYLCQANNILILRPVNDRLLFCGHQ